MLLVAQEKGTSIGHLPRSNPSDVASGIDARVVGLPTEADDALSDAIKNYHLSLCSLRSATLLVVSFHSFIPARAALAQCNMALTASNETLQPVSIYFLPDYLKIEGLVY